MLPPKNQHGQHDRISVVLVSPRNPLNIGAAARAMANFGFRQLTIVAPYEPNWLETKSAIGAEDLLQTARRTATLAEAISNCTLVVGTGTLTWRKPEQQVVQLPDLVPLVDSELARHGRIAIVFGPEKHGLTRDDLARCHCLVEIPTDPRQPSMNLGQAVAVCLYELAVRCANEETIPPAQPTAKRMAAGKDLELLAGVVEEAMAASNYRPIVSSQANARELRVMLRRLAPTERDARRILGVFRRILWRLKQTR
ncbi:MAG: TrmH family RNA methyltransferase [Terracidiphilus sp.]